MKTRTIATITVIAALTSCTVFIDCIEGNGDIKTESRAAVPFTAIANETSFHVVYIQGDEYTVTVEAESNLLPFIETEIKNGALGIKTNSDIHCLRYTTQPVITITAPSVSEIVSSGSGDIVAAALDGEEVRLVTSGSGDITAGTIAGSEVSIVISGSGNIMTDDISCTTMEAILSGSGNLTMTGEAVSSRYVVSGSGSIFSRELVAEEAVVNMTGSGSVYTAVTDHLTAVISSSGNIYLQGDPSVNLTRTGSGRVIYL
ncbi:MAG: head GIN domain-containing protein [Bacteroidales bacterium]|jgi:hypothetical protein|nr:head GIN domain-containing protein [Bacteroidales bacterium]